MMMTLRPQRCEIEIVGRYMNVIHDLLAGNVVVVVFVICLQTGADFIKSFVRLAVQLRDFNRKSMSNSFSFSNNFI